MLKALHALPSWLERFACADEQARDEKGCTPRQARDARVAPPGMQNPQAGDAMVAPETNEEKRPTEKRVYPCFFENEEHRGEVPVTHDQLFQMIQARPFRPYRLKTAGGREIAVTHPEAIAYAGEAARPSWSCPGTGSRS